MRWVSVDKEYFQRRDGCIDCLREMVEGTEFIDGNSSYVFVRSRVRGKKREAEK